MSRRDRFTREFVPAAQEICRVRGVPWQVCVVQAYVESGWGFRGLASDEHNNRWGIKAGRVDSPATVEKMTTEYLKRGKVRLKARFASWPTMEAGIDGWIAFISRSRYLRPSAWDFEDDPARFITWIWGKGYATAPYYVERYVRVSRKLAEKIGDRSLMAEVDPALERCIEEIRAQAPGPLRVHMTKALGAYGFSGACVERVPWTS